MVFDEQMIQRVYESLPQKITEIKNKLQRPLTLTEKILFSHLADNEPLKNYEQIGRAHV